MMRFEGKFDIDAVLKRLVRFGDIKSGYCTDLRLMTDCDNRVMANASWVPKTDITLSFSEPEIGSGWSRV